MRIALYTLAIDRTSGKEAVILELARRSAHDWTMMAGRVDLGRTFPGLADADLLDLRHGWLARRGDDERGLVLDACLHLPRTRLPLEGYDALVVLSAGLEQLVTFANPGVPSACVCMTPLRLAYDPSFREAYRARRSFGPMKGALAGAFRAGDAMSWNRFGRVWCISEEVRSRLARNGGVDGSRAAVLYPGVDAASVEPSWRWGRYFLAPGRINWTKNLGLVVEAFRSSSAAAEGFELVIAGMAAPDDRPYLDSLRALVGDDASVRIVESPSSDELRDLYAGSYAVLFGAVNEDFGIVPLEGMAHGKPVVCLDQGGPRETVVDGTTGLLVSDVDGFASAIATLAEQPGLVETMGRAAREHALGFDWRHFVERTDAALEEFVAEAAAR